MTTATANQYENSEFAAEALGDLKTSFEAKEQQARDAWGMKRQLQEARSNHTFTVEMYGVELPFNPLPDEAADAIKEKRERMADCLQANDFEGFTEQAGHISEHASEWLAEAWNGDGSMSEPADWEDTYDDTERMELLTKVDQRGEGEEMEAVLQFLGGN